jgi:hypothetical protein
VLGPNGLSLIEHVLDVLEPHPADNATKIDAFAMLSAITAIFVQNEPAGGSAARRRSNETPPTYSMPRCQANTHGSLSWLRRRQQRRPTPRTDTTTSSPGCWPACSQHRRPAPDRPRT